jgi:transcriptional regulator with XRE-family HTH domain
MDKDTTDARSALAARIEDLRVDQGLTIDGLAERAQVDRRQIEEMLEGTSDVGISVILRLAGALDVKIEKLLDGISWSPGPSGGEYRAEDPEAR